MLYDKRWEKPEIKADPFSLESLIAWLEQQPADGTYQFMDCSGMCLLGQYMSSVGVAWSPEGYRNAAYSICQNYRDLNFYIGVSGDYTFGAALKRAREILKSRQPSLWRRLLLRLRGQTYS